MKSLNIESHPVKTWLGRVKNGFDYLRILKLQGFRIIPKSIHPAINNSLSASTSRRFSYKECKVARLYEQGASKKRIGQYLRRWLGWSILTLMSGSAYAVGPNSGSFATPDLGVGSFVSFKHTNDTFNSNYPYGVFVVSASRCDVVIGSNCTNSCPAPLPIGGTSTLTSIPAGASAITTLTFATPGVDLIDTTSTYCLVQDGHGSLWAINRLPANLITTANSTSRIQICAPTDVFDTATGCSRPTEPTAVPIFTPLGIVATIGGLLWFGRRRKAIKLTQN